MKVYQYRVVYVALNDSLLPKFLEGPIEGRMNTVFKQALETFTTPANYKFLGIKNSSGDWVAVAHERLRPLALPAISK